MEVHAFTDTSKPQRLVGIMQNMETQREGETDKKEALDKKKNVSLSLVHFTLF